jgi:hypothetical protein
VGEDTRYKRGFEVRKLEGRTGRDLAVKFFGDSRWDCLVDVKLTGGCYETAFKDQEHKDINREEPETSTTTRPILHSLHNVV